MIFERYIYNYMHRFDQLDRLFWNYEDGCVLIGAQAMYEATGDEYFFHSIKSFIDRYVSSAGIKYYDQTEYNIDKIPSGRVLYLLCQKTGRKEYRAAIETLMDQLRAHPRTESGSFWHKKIYPGQIWLDGLYMGLPFYMLYENNYGTGAGYADVIRQFRNARACLYNEDKKVYYHAYDEKKQMFWADRETGLSANVWSRAMGWYLMALADCYELMPAKQEEYRNELAGLWQEAMDGMLLYQEEKSGLFYQLTLLPEEPGNYLETSASAMVAYSLLKGSRLGVFADEVYQVRAERILLGLQTNMFFAESGKLELGGMCVGAGLGPEDNLKRDGSIGYYLAEPVVKDEQKGVGAVMMAYSEWLKLQLSAASSGGTGGGGYPSCLGGIEVDIYNRGY